MKGISSVLPLTISDYYGMSSKGVCGFRTAPYTQVDNTNYASTLLCSYLAIVCLLICKKIFIDNFLG